MPEIQTGGRLMHDEAIAVEVTFHIPGCRRRVDTKAFEMPKGDEVGTETETDSEMIHISKDLFISEEYRAVSQFDGSVKRWLRAKALPSVLRASYYLIPFVSVEEIDAYLTDSMGKRQELVDRFIAVYLQRKQEAEQRLGPLYNEADYPSVNRMKNAFDLTIRYVSFTTPTGLRSISKELFNREREKAKIQWEQAMEKINDLLEAEMQACVDHMVERLTPGEDGKAKIWKATLVENMRTFLDNFPARNINDHQELAALVDQAKGLLLGIDAETIKKCDDLKTGLAQGFTEIKARMDDLVMNRPSRKISFDESAA